jgi:hypothetical protein
MSKETAMRLAFEKLGITNYKYEQEIDIPALSDAEVIHKIVEARASLEDINTQLADDEERGFSRDQGWRKRAQTARRANSRLCHILREEASKRRILNLLPENVEKMERRAAIAAQELENAKKRQAVKQQNIAKASELAEIKLKRAQVAAERTKEQSRLFIQAALSILGRDKYLEIWDAARSMFPDNPAWGNPD